MSKSKSRARFAQVIRTYAQLEQFAEAFANQHLNLLVLTGAPGLGKSRVVRSAVDSQTCCIDGNTTAFGMYMKLYHARNQLVIIDDVDSLHKDRHAIRLLKSLCQTEPVKTVSWNTDARTLDRQNIPREFTTVSKVAIIANDWSQVNIDVAALEDRGHAIHFDPSAWEVHVQVAKWFWDQEVFDFIAAHLHLVEQPSCRHYLAAAELKQAGLDWKGSVLSRCIIGKALVVARLKADTTYATEEDRARAFVEVGEGCRATYFSIAKKLRPPGEIPKLTLVNLSLPTVPLPAVDLVQLLKKRFGELGYG